MLLITQADARALPFRDASVQCVVTSPPYFGLRDYGTARWEGGDPACDHVEQYTHPMLGACSGGVTNRRPDLEARQTASQSGRKQFRGTCGKCGATRIDQQIGLEPTIDAYVAQLVTVFREVWRVLKADGVCWLNLGDSYAGGAQGRFDNSGADLARRAAQYGSGTGNGRGPTSGIRRSPTDGLKPKDLCMIPARVALALQADGWYLRSEIVWSKPNPMPESVTDRPTKAHEMIYLLAKAERYYFDAEAVRERSALSSLARAGITRKPSPKELASVAAGHWNGAPGENGKAYGIGRNIRSVWHIATQPYAGAHFATMPEKLVERCILAGSRAGDLVLDPFLGSGTVARVALRLGRRALGSDLNPEYLELADDRTTVTLGLPFGPMAIA